MSVELHDREPLPLEAGDWEDAAVLACRPAGRLVTLGDTAAMGTARKLRLGDGDEVLAAEIRCRGRDEGSRAAAGELRKPAEEIVVRLWPGLPPGGPWCWGRRWLCPPAITGFTCATRAWRRPWEWRETMVLASARVNGLVTNLPGLARERIDLVFWAGQSPGEQVIQAGSAFGREMAAAAEGIREQLARE